jgi:GxxExxY protein
MNTDVSFEQLNRITGDIIGAAQRVSSGLGCGFLEKVYENALALELRRNGHRVSQQHAVDVRYLQEIVGQYYTDLLVDGCVVVELKSVPSLGNNHRAQCLNYLRATGLRLSLLLNFGRPRLQYERVIHGY